MTEESMFLMGKVESLAKAVEYTPDSVLSRALITNDAGNITMFAISKGQVISEHTSPFDAFVYIIEGKAVVTIDGTQHSLKAGEAIIMPANVPHALSAPEDFKMLLVMLKPEQK